jgi:hypothetical protein
MKNEPANFEFVSFNPAPAVFGGFDNGVDVRGV